MPRLYTVGGGGRACARAGEPMEQIDEGSSESEAEESAEEEEAEGEAKGEMGEAKPKEGHPEPFWRKLQAQASGLSTDSETEVKASVWVGDGRASALPSSPHVCDVRLLALVLCLVFPPPPSPGRPRGLYWALPK